MLRGGGATTNGCGEATRGHSAYSTPSLCRLATCLAFLRASTTLMLPGVATWLSTLPGLLPKGDIAPLLLLSPCDSPHAPTLRCWLRLLTTHAGVMRNGTSGKRALALPGGAFSRIDAMLSTLWRLLAAPEAAANSRQAVVHASPPIEPALARRAMARAPSSVIGVRGSWLLSGRRDAARRPSELTYLRGVRMSTGLAHWRTASVGERLGVNTPRAEAASAKLAGEAASSSSRAHVRAVKGANGARCGFCAGLPSTGEAVRSSVGVPGAEVLADEMDDARPDEWPSVVVCDSRRATKG